MNHTDSDETRMQAAALWQGAGFCDVSERTLVEVRGKDRAQLIHNLCTNDVMSLRPGTGCEAFITSVQGKTLGHVFIFCHADSLMIDTVPQQADFLCTHIDRYTIREDVIATEVGGDLCQLVIAGALSGSTLTKLGIAAPESQFEHKHGQIAEVSTTIAKIPMVTADSFMIYASMETRDTLCGRLESAGITRCGSEALEIVRIESGFPLFGVDISPDNLPQEIGRDEQAICFSKGCYLGQETVARIDALGHVNRLLQKLRVEGVEPPLPGAEIRRKETVVGHVTSAAPSVLDSHARAIAVIRRGVNDHLEINGRLAQMVD